MRHFLVVTLSLFLPALACAEQPYFPKFARVEQRAEMFDLTLLCNKPEYPKVSFYKREEGTATVLLTVAPTGRITHVALEKSSGSSDLDKATLRIGESCAYRPASINGAPVQDVVKLQYVWTLQ